MSAETLATANYRLPELWTHMRDRCRDCGSARKNTNCGNRLSCARHGDTPIRASHRCDLWHPRGTLL